MTSPLYFSSYSDSEINIILRDLGESENLNVKDLLTKHDKQKKTCSKKKTKLSKKELIIQKNKLKKGDKLNKRDDERLGYYANLHRFDASLFNELPNFETDSGKLKMKLKLLKLAYDKSMTKHVINLYLQVLRDEYESKSDKKLIKRITKFMNKIDYKKLQFKELSNELSPLDFYNDYEKSLDSWQLKVLKYIDNGDSVLITAPTSCGKTWLSLYPGIKGKKVLFLVPTDALVFQVSSMFAKFATIPMMITDDWCYGTNTNIVVGTPESIEDKLPALGNDFDVVVFDEIHNLNNLNLSQYYERLIKIFADKQILALSATIGDAPKLLKWLQKINEKKFKLVTYTTRFLNLQRQLFMNNKLVKLHPMSCLSLTDINRHYLMNNLPMTPYDCVQLYEALYEILPDKMNGLDVKEVFSGNNRRLSLDNAREYEVLLKNKLLELTESNSTEIIKILDKFKIDDSDNKEANLYALFKEIKEKNLIPCIVFQQNTSYCKEIYSKLVHYLEKLEELNYPYYYDNLEYRQKCFLASEKEIKKFRATIKLPKDITNPVQFMDDKIETKREELNAKFLENYIKNIDRKIKTLQKSNADAKIINIQVTNLKKELQEFISNPKLKYIDVFQKHKDFCLNYENPMSAEKIREIKRTIQSKLGINVTYTNAFMQGLKRGIGIYTKHMPPVYNMTVQRLAQNGELGFVVADERLALGINMPFRSTCILGYKDSKTFDTHTYLQMIGRAGRRGKDCEGHNIFANVDWRMLMKSELSEIQSKYKHIENYNVLAKFTDNFSHTVGNIFKYKMNEKRDESNNISSLPINDKFYSKKILVRKDSVKDITDEYEIIPDGVLNAILWKLRIYNKEGKKLCDNLFNLNNEFRISTDHNTIKKLTNIIMNIIHPDSKDNKDKLNNIIRLSKLVENSYEEYMIVYEFMKIIKTIYNSLINDIDNNYKFLNIHLKYTFHFFKTIIFNSNDLN